jgi:hypothetical protein
MTRMNLCLQHVSVSLEGTFAMNIHAAHSYSVLYVLLRRHPLLCGSSPTPPQPGPLFERHLQVP